MEGIDWRSWTAADRAAVTFLLLKRQLDPPGLRELYELVGDSDALAAIDRDILGQSAQLEAADVRLRHG